MAVTNHYIKIHTAQARRELDQLALKSKTTTTSMAVGFVALKDVAGGITSIFKTMGMAAAGAGIAIGGSFMLSTMALGNYEYNLRRIAAIGGKEFEDRLDSINSKVMELSLNFGISQEQLSAGIIDLVKQGFTYAETMATIDSATKLAVGTGTDFNAVITATRGVLRAYNLNIKDLPAMMDKIAYVADRTALDVNGLGDSLQYAAQMTSMAGMSVEETVTFLGVMEDQFMKDSIAARGLSNMILQLSEEAKSSKIQALLKEMGVTAEIFTAEGELNVIEIIDQWSQLNMTWEQASRIMTELDNNSGRAWASMARGVPRFKEIMASMGEATGRSEDLAESMTKTIPVTMERLKAAFIAGIAGMKMEVGEDGMIEVLGGVGGIETMEQVWSKLFIAMLPVAKKFGSFVRDTLPLMLDLIPKIVDVLTKLIDALVDSNVIERLLPMLNAFLGVLSAIAPILPEIIALWIAWKIAVAAHSIAVALDAARMWLVINASPKLIAAVTANTTAYLAWGVAILGVTVGLGMIFMGISQGNEAMAAMGGIILTLTVLFWLWSSAAWSVAGAIAVITLGAAATIGAVALAGAMHQSQVKKSAEGFEGMVHEPTLFLAGEAGSEYVSIKNKQQMANTNPDKGINYDMRQFNIYEASTSKTQKYSKRLGGLR